jgi:hypothetical protein
MRCGHLIVDTFSLDAVVANLSYPPVVRKDKSGAATGRPTIKYKITLLAKAVS